MNGSEKTLSYGQGMQSCGRVTSTSFYRRIGKNLQRGHIRPPPRRAAATAAIRCCRNARANAV